MTKTIATLLCVVGVASAHGAWESVSFTGVTTAVTTSGPPGPSDPLNPGDPMSLRVFFNNTNNQVLGWTMDAGTEHGSSAQLFPNWSVDLTNTPSGGWTVFLTQGTPAFNPGWDFAIVDAGNGAWDLSLARNDSHEFDIGVLTSVIAHVPEGGSTILLMGLSSVGLLLCRLPTKRDTKGNP
jgi:hypothetical protein